MTDYSEAEMLAIEKVFPEARIYLCDFHCEQAWQRWTKNRNHGLNDDEASALLVALRSLAYDPPCRDEGQAPDKHFREAESKLQDVDVFRSNMQVRNWLNGKWLSIPEVLKYSFLNTSNGKKRTLSETFTIIVERFLEEQKRKFVVMDVSQLSSFRSSTAPYQSASTTGPRE
ncbi:uncharacterized protein LOC135823477 [Sycon ciliatum]|uniref:uncharacterized protein LOC135823477 n=1 Tax=Sycon ciliatum TaxID=27933 RepID=UPI0031F6F67F